MARILLALFSFCVMLPMQSPAEEVVLGLSRNKVQITTNFKGSEILIFGAIKREAAIPDGPPVQVIITVAGPSERLSVYKKDRKLGIWVNSEMVEVDAAPSFYAIATSAPWDEVITDTDDLRHSISIPRAIRSVGAPMDVQDAAAFTEAVIRIRKDKRQYQLLEESVAVSEQTLFRTSIKMPADLTEGEYNTRIFLTREGRVIAEYERGIPVQKVGLERWLFNMSRQQPLLYGLMSLAIAIAAGWGASAAFRMLRNS